MPLFQALMSGWGAIIALRDAEMRAIGPVKSDKDSYFPVPRLRRMAKEALNKWLCKMKCKTDGVRA